METLNLIECIFLKRYKRFFADIEINGEKHTAHVPNTGSLKGTVVPPARAWVSHSADPKRKLSYTLEYIGDEGGLRIGVNTHRPNRIVEAYLQQQMEAKMYPYDALKREAAFSEKTKFDFCLSRSGSEKQLWIEVKNVSMKMGEHAAFPDAVTARGAKHLDELVELKMRGHDAELWFIIQRNDCVAMKIAADIDPHYAARFLEAKSQGIKMRAFCLKADIARPAIGHEIGIIENEQSPEKKESLLVSEF